MPTGSCEWLGGFHPLILPAHCSGSTVTSPYLSVKQSKIIVKDIYIICIKVGFTPKKLPFSSPMMIACGINKLDQQHHYPAAPYNHKSSYKAPHIIRHIAHIPRLSIHVIGVVDRFSIICTAQVR